MIIAPPHVAQCLLSLPGGKLLLQFNACVTSPSSKAASAQPNLETNHQTCHMPWPWFDDVQLDYQSIRFQADLASRSMQRLHYKTIRRQDRPDNSIPSPRLNEAWDQRHLVIPFPLSVSQCYPTEGPRDENFIHKELTYHTTNNRRTTKMQSCNSKRENYSMHGNEVSSDL